MRTQSVSAYISPYPLSWVALFPIQTLAQYTDDPVNSAYLGLMLLGGFTFLAFIGALVALSIFLLRKSGTYKTRRPMEITP
ncbi:MAG TPA: hypothetical protein PKC28_07500 [Bdellovibrionales bacterium]|nr:hypothetical protein [Bdellovibrionales bacterium]